MIRLFTLAPLQAGRGVTLTPEQSHYLIKVMRQGMGAEVALFNGRDGEWRARLVETGKRGGALEVGERQRAQHSGPDLELIVALVKRARLETIVEKAAELGARRVRPVTTRRTNADRANVARLTAIAVEASEQTGRLDVPEVVAPEPLERLLDGWPAGRRLMFCDEGGDGSTIDRVDGPSGWSILIGPEGGFAPDERDRLRALPFVTPVSLGPRILRADTAAIAAMALWQAVLGDWRRAS